MPSPGFVLQLLRRSTGGPNEALTAEERLEMGSLYPGGDVHQPSHGNDNLPVDPKFKFAWSEK